MEEGKIIGEVKVNVVENENNESINDSKTTTDTNNFFEDILNQFSDEIESDELKKSKSFINDFMNFIKGNNFKEMINNKAKKFGIPPKRLAKNFFEKVLGTIGDVLSVCINTVGNAYHTTIDLLSSVLHGTGNIVIGIANAISSVLTLNYKC